MSEQKVVEQIELPPRASVDHTELTDDDLRDLVIYYATIIRRPGSVQISPVRDAWRAWPKELRDRFDAMVRDEALKGNYFWSRPADNNIRYGI